MMNEYVNEKLRQLDEERLHHTLNFAAQMQDPAQDKKSDGKRVIGPALRLAGRTLRKVGAGLEHWAEPRTTETERVGFERRSW